MSEPSLRDIEQLLLLVCYTLKIYPCDELGHAWEPEGFSKAKGTAWRCRWCGRMREAKR